MEQYQPRFKYISDNSKLILEDFKAVFQKLTFSTVYAMEDPEDKLDIFNNLVTECVHRNAPLKWIKCTRSPAPWWKSLDIQQLISECNRKRYLAHLTKKTSDWTAYRTVRNKLKHAKRTMSKGEFTLSVYSDYTKAFDTVQHHTVIQTLHKIGFSTSALKWFISYLRNRLPYGQVNNSKSAIDRVILVFCKGLYWVHCYLIST